MFEIFLITHGSFSDGLKNAANLIIGTTENVHTFNLNPGDDINKLNETMTKLISELGESKGVLFLTDLTNASPYNQSLLTINNLSKENQGNKFVISGVNLPILIQAISEQMMGSTIEEAVDTIISEGMNGISKWNALSLDSDDEDDDF